ncbi:hypothetical protein BDV96DRAFT_662975 [Lophiotrema nucula]|uniref:Uncharacterized protein n=1 Tax=Lophiotrema nucula TaxID=690887 RepID=A0A6A5ZSG2_9PLEO|nr:hypothetical protein BDV96DRAFT_662975 [Lophiotrema nucula]
MDTDQNTQNLYPDFSDSESDGGIALDSATSDSNLNDYDPNHDLPYDTTIIPDLELANLFDQSPAQNCLDPDQIMSVYSQLPGHDPAIAAHPFEDAQYEDIRCHLLKLSKTDVQFFKHACEEVLPEIELLFDAICEPKFTESSFARAYHKISDSSGSKYDRMLSNSIFQNTVCVYETVVHLQAYFDSVPQRQEIVVSRHQKLDLPPATSTTTR